MAFLGEPLAAHEAEADVLSELARRTAGFEMIALVMHRVDYKAELDEKPRGGCWHFRVGIRLKQTSSRSSDGRSVRQP